METLPPELKCIIIEKMIQSGDIIGLLSLRLVNYEWFNMIPIDNVVRLKFNTDIKLMRWILKEGNMDMFDYYKNSVNIKVIYHHTYGIPEYDPIMFREICFHYCKTEEDVINMFSTSFMTTLIKNKHFEVFKDILHRYNFGDKSYFDIFYVEDIYGEVVRSGNLDMLKFLYGYFVDWLNYEDVIHYALDGKSIECAYFIKENFDKCHSNRTFIYNTMSIYDCYYINDDNTMAIDYLIENHNILDYIRIEAYECKSDEMRELLSY